MKEKVNIPTPAGRNPDPSRFVSASQLARMCSVSRQFISKVIKEGMLRKTPNGLIDLKDELTILFIEERRGRAKSDEPNIPAGLRVVTDDEAGDEEDDAEQDVNFLNLKIRKLQGEVKKRELEIAQIEGSVIDERIIASLIGELGQGIRLNFIDVCLRQSEQLSAVLGVPGREREVEAYLEVDNGRRLEEVKRGVTKIMHAMKRKVRQEVDHE
jgi:hypothetical protein